MKKLILICLTVMLAACGGNDDAPVAATTPTDNSGAANNANNTNNANNNGAGSPGANTMLSSSQLLSDSYQDGSSEIQLSQIALQRSSNDRVKTFAQRMIDDHTTMNAEITRLAQARGVTLPNAPTADQAATASRLQGLSGAEFDRAYMDANVTVHDKDVAQFRLQSTQASDAEIRQLAAVGYPLLKSHLDAADQVNGLVNPSAFLISAYRDGLMEVQMSQLALQKSSTNSVRTFAQRMITDHTNLNSQISQLAATKSVTLPNTLTTEQQAELAALGRLSGADFDKAYMDLNVIAHTKDVADAQLQSQENPDAQVKALALASLPTLQQHLQLATDLNNTLQPSFLYGAAQSNMASLVQANLALIRSTNPTVRAFAQQAITALNGLSNQLNSLAQQNNLVVPTGLSATQAATLEDLLTRTPEAFDRAFVTANQTALSREITNLQAQIPQITDANLRSFANALLAAWNSLQTAAQGITT